jgi:ATP-independent RNA helicase DbpA
MVLCPTRELADQVTQEIRRLARAEDNIKILSLVGGSTLRPQRASLEHGAHIVVGTPGRIMDHLERGSLSSTPEHPGARRSRPHARHGLLRRHRHVAKQCPKKRQTLLFSATYPEGIAKLAKQFMRQPRK